MADTGPGARPRPATSQRAQEGAVAAGGGGRRRGLGWLWLLLLLLLLGIIALIIWLTQRGGDDGAVGAGATTSPSASAAAPLTATTPDTGTTPDTATTPDTGTTPSVPAAVPTVPVSPSTPASPTAPASPATPTSSVPSGADASGTPLSGGAGTAATPITTPAAGQLGTALFADGSAALTAQSRQVLDSAAAQVRSAGLSSVTVAGFSDDSGTAAANSALSRQRAEAVAGALRSQLTGTSTTVRTLALGQQDPAEANTSPAGRAANRRVTLTAPGTALIGGGGVPVHPAAGSAALPDRGVGVALFDVDSAQLGQASRTVLSDTASSIKRSGATAVTVTGYASEPGSAADNLALSRRRAEAVAAALRTDLGPSSTVTVVARGETRQVASNATEVGRQLNRRAVVTTG